MSDFKSRRRPGMLSLAVCVVAGAAISLMATTATAMERPPANPFLADSVNPIGVWELTARSGLGQKGP
ncbi:MAG: hypothetical protein P8K76_13085 [Candidatus Binatia bacterium]|nr:hypothetical protein [Candidatus Binatia bacterium]